MKDEYVDTKCKLYSRRDLNKIWRELVRMYIFVYAAYLKGPKNIEQKNICFSIFFVF